MDVPDDSPSVGVLFVVANGGELLTESFRDRFTLGECLTLEIYRLVRWSVNPLSRQTSHQLSKLRRISLGLFHFTMEGVARRYITDITNPDFKSRYSGVSRIGCSQPIALFNEREGFRREIRGERPVTASRDVSTGGLKDSFPQNLFTFRAGRRGSSREKGVEVGRESLPISATKVSKRTTGAYVVEFVLTERIEERNEDGQMIGI